MQVTLLRVGIDSAAGGMQGPLFRDGSFEYIPIPDILGVSQHTYGSIFGRHRHTLVEYFPRRRQPRMRDCPVHDDPEFQSFTYGDRNMHKLRLTELGRGDLLVFYAGLEGWDFLSPPALYIIGYFEVSVAGKATRFSSADLERLFSRNFHVRDRHVFAQQRDKLILVKGTEKSRLLKKACKISSIATDKIGRPLKVLSPEMRRIFGRLSEENSLQRSGPPRWVPPEFVSRAASFVLSLE